MVTDRDGENDGEGQGPPPLSSSSLQKPLLTPVTSITLTSVTLASIEKNKSSTNHKNNANGDEDDVSASNEDEMIALKAKLSASPRTSGQEVNGTEEQRQEDEGNEDEYLDLDDLCEVVLSFKCRHCNFLCQDKGALTSHVKNSHNHHTHQSKVPKTVLKIQKEDLIPNANGNGHHPQNEGSSEFGESLSKKNGVHKVELPPTPSIPATPDPILVDDSMISPEEEEAELGTADAQEGVTLEDQVEDVFLCAECDIVFASKELCCSHMHQVHDLMQFNPDFIQDEIISKNPTTDNPLPKRRRTQLPKHLTAEGGSIVPKRFRVTKEVFYTCSKCSVRFESNDVMKFHEQCHAKEETTTTEDHNTSNSTSNRKTSSRGGFACPVCETKTTDPSSSEVFAKWGQCAGHLWREHKIDCELYTCTVCKQFKSNLITRVKEHERLHMRQSIYLCKTCKKTFKQLKQLRCHEKFHKEKMTKLSPPLDSRWYTPKECHICKRILSDAKCLKKHISAVHNKLKPYCCNICGHMTARKAELQLHMRIHTQEKPYKCPFCSFSTGDHNSLRKHKLRHTDKRPYVCPYCDYRCIQSCAFKKHILAVHPGQEVVFVCQLCSHASVNEILFAAHQKDHAQESLRSNHLNNSSEGQEKESGNEAENHSSEASSSKNKSKKRSEQPTWLEEDSVDVVDTGGVTIPASPVDHNEEPTGPEIIQENGKENAEASAIDATTKETPPAPTTATRSIESIVTLPPTTTGQTTYILLPPNTPLPFITNMNTANIIHSGVSSAPQPLHQEGLAVSEENNLSSKGLEMPHLDALDLAEVINAACNQPSSSNDSMFEKLLGMSGGI